jgi:hypothetical protein
MDQNVTNRGAGSRQISRSYRPKGENYLLVIGIDDYQYAPKLYNAVKDARDVSKILFDHYQFEAKNSIELYNAQATQSEIIRQFRELANKTGEDDNLLIYFSGHGEYDPIIDTGYWIPVDGKLGEIGTFIDFHLITRFVKVIKTHHTFIIADSCYSGTLFTDRSAAQVLDHLESIPSRWLLTAGRNEVVSDGKPGDNSPFADAILYRLRHNQEPRLRVSDFCNLIITDVRSNARQLPRGDTLRDVGHRGGEFMFRLKAHAREAFEESIPERLVQVPQGVDRGGGSTMPGPPPPPAVPETFPNVDALKMSLKSLLAADEFEQVFALLNRALTPGASMANDLILQQGQYNGMRRDEMNGTITAENLNIRRARLRSALLYYVDRLDANNTQKNILSA